MWSEVVWAVLAPGRRVWSRRPQPRRWLSAVLFVAGVGLPVALGVTAVASGRSWVALTLDEGFLAWLIVIGAVAVAARVAAVAEVWIVGGRSGAARDRWAFVAAVAVLVPAVVGLVQVGRARASLAPAFPDTADGLLYDPAAPTLPRTADSAATTVRAATVPTTVDGAIDAAPATLATSELDRVGAPTTTSSTSTTTTTTLPPPLPERPRSGVDPAVVADVRTVLLLGGDAGPGRFGLRTDTMMLFSLHEPSGRAALISIPRNLRGLLFPPGSELERRHPYGFGDLANAVHPYVTYRRDVRAHYTVEGIEPGVVATAHGIGYSFDVPIDDYVLVDMAGFIRLIDALGGVTLDLPAAVPMPGNVPGAPHQYPETIGPGVVEMDGTVALGYARSREGDSDYHRTARQRRLLAALATQVSFDDVVLSYGEVSRAVGGALRTSLDPDQLAEMLAVIGGETAIVESVGLVPPLVNVNRPNYQRLAEIVGAVRVALATGVPSGY